MNEEASDEYIWTSINMRPKVKKIVNTISKRDGMFAYAVVEKALRNTYPTDFPINK